MHHPNSHQSRSLDSLGHPSGGGKRGLRFRGSAYCAFQTEVSTYRNSWQHAKKGGSSNSKVSQKIKTGIEQVFSLARCPSLVPCGPWTQNASSSSLPAAPPHRPMMSLPSRPRCCCSPPPPRASPSPRALPSGRVWPRTSLLRRPCTGEENTRLGSDWAVLRLQQNSPARLYPSETLLTVQRGGLQSKSKEVTSPLGIQCAFPCCNQISTPRQNPD